jgi:hypothetical protein
MLQYPSTFTVDGKKGLDDETRKKRVTDMGREEL